jgi:hypothetical protein
MFPPRAGISNGSRPADQGGRSTVHWADDGEEFLETVALGWTGKNVYVRMSDTRYQLRAVWLDAADVTRR